MNTEGRVLGKGTKKAEKNKYEPGKMIHVEKFHNKIHYFAC